MIRRLATAAPVLALALGACGSPDAPAEAPPTPPATDVPAAPAEPPVSNHAAGTSIMRPAVADEVAPTPTPTPDTPPPPVTIGFGDGGAALDDAAKAALDALIAAPGFATAGDIVLRGHSDSSGSDRDNVAASRRRAEAVRAHLVEQGVASDRISVVAIGERRPIAPNAHPDGSDYEEGRRRNRRVEIEVRPATPAPAPQAEDDAAGATKG